MSDLDRSDDYWAWHEREGYRRIVNVSGTMTGLGASIASRPVREATAAAMSRFVKIHELQATASTLIGELTGAEAGCLTASASAAITLCTAGCMTGMDPGRADALPTRPGPRSEVAVLAGHLCGYGAPVATAVALAGATVRPVGQSTLAMDFQLEAALDERTAAALYVISHHVVHYGQIPFERFVEICRARAVPVIVDAASEYDLRGFVEKGADLVIYSAHKFLGGPTAGIVAGKRAYVRAAYLQNIGIGRGFKIGKESIAGTIAALRQWQTRDHAAARAEEARALTLWLEATRDLPGVVARVVADPTGNPLDRLQIDVDAAKAGAAAATFARAFAEQDPAIIVRGHEVELGYLQLDPCNLVPGQAELVAGALRRTLSDGERLVAHADDVAVSRNGGVDAYLGWLAEPHDR